MYLLLNMNHQDNTKIHILSKLGTKKPEENSNLPIPSEIYSLSNYVLLNNAMA